MEPLKEFEQELKKFEKQRAELKKRIRSIMQKLREKYPTKHPDVEHLLDIAERNAENELDVFYLDRYYKKGYQDIEIGASYREILRKYRKYDEKTVIDPSEHFDIVFSDFQFDTGPFVLDIELDEDNDTIKQIHYYDN